MEIITNNFDTLKEDIENTKKNYLNNKYSEDETKEMYLLQRNNLLNYINKFDDVSKKELINRVNSSKTKTEFKRNKKILEEYKKLKNNEFFVDNVTYFDNIPDLIENDSKELKMAIVLKIPCEIIGIIALAITIYFKYNILLFPFENLLKYFITMIFMYYSALFLDYTRESIKEDISELSKLKYTLKKDNKTTVK